MSLNTRQVQHVERAQKCAKLGSILYALCKQVKESHDEEFSTGQSNEIETADLEAQFFYDLATFNSAINQFVTNYNNLWDNEAINTREYGKDARGIISHDNERLNNIF